MHAAARKSRLIKGATGDWEVVIGMEIHAQVTSSAKLFSGASTEFGGAPNDHVSLVDAAMPGMLPVINEHCVAQAVRTGLGLKAQINRKSVFDRKNYFYPDLPQGYQISQYKSPIVGEGVVVVDMEDGESIEVGIERVHLEQDAGKLLHDQHPSSTCVDLNRSGVALMEIVSKPDLRSADEAKAYVSKLRTILRYLGTCDGDMEKGSLRADVNVSVRQPGAPLGTRCEVKNVNSIRFIGQAVESEARRQIEILEEGGEIVQETRLFDPGKGETRAMRSKEEAHDYRYFPDPDLLPLEFDEAFVQEIAANLPELPDEKKVRYVQKFGLSAYEADVLIASYVAASFFETVAEHDPANAKMAASWTINELFGRLNKEGRTFDQLPITSYQLGALLMSLGAGTITTVGARKVLDVMWREGKGSDPGEVIERLGLRDATNVNAIQTAIDVLFIEHPDKVEDARVKPQAIGWFVGQVMKRTAGKANPNLVNELLRKKLDVQ
jgi:aspartyl-tRNA(Asn)/glutamyl-tRNA(Gln) amidotransferase subunit B